MPELVRTDTDNEDFRKLVTLLDAELSRRDGEEHVFYAQFNGLDRIRHVIVAYEDGLAIGCGAFRAFDETTVEIKRMYVLDAFRGKGIAGKILSALEQWAVGNGFRQAVLETGYNQPEAIALYTKAGYVRIPNYGPYAGVFNSVCMKKELPVSTFI
jgi:GNAT superfamily N-acetyltransferase